MRTGHLDVAEIDQLHKQLRAPIVPKTFEQPVAQLPAPTTPTEIVPIQTAEVPLKSRYRNHNQAFHRLRNKMCHNQWVHQFQSRHLQNLCLRRYHLLLHLHWVPGLPSPPMMSPSPPAPLPPPLAPLPAGPPGMDQPIPLDMPMPEAPRIAVQGTPSDEPLITKKEEEQDALLDELS